MVGRAALVLGQPWFCAGLFSPQQGSSAALASAWLFAHRTVLWMDSTSKLFLDQQLSYASEFVIFFKLIQMALLFFGKLCFSCGK